MTLNDLIARVEDAGITVSWTYLHSCNAGWDYDKATIWLDHSLASKPRHAVSTLAHEWAHAIRGDKGRQAPHIEARCDVIAAGILISPTEYKLAEALHEGNPHSIAVELGVTTRIVKAYQMALVAKI